MNAIKYNAIKYVILCVLSLVLVSCVHSNAPIQHQTYNMMFSKRIYVDSTFDKDERILIQKAADTWETGTRGIAKFDLVFDFDMSKVDSNDSPYEYSDKIILRKNKSTDRAIALVERAYNQELEEENGLEAGTSNETILGYTLPKSHLTFVFLVVDRLKSPIQYQSVVAHEFGHVIQLRHFDGGPALMNSSWDINIEPMLIGHKRTSLTCLTKYDLQEFCSIYQCEWEKLNPC